MAMDGVIFDFLGNIAVGFAATIAVLAVVGLSIPTRAARHPATIRSPARKLPATFRHEIPKQPGITPAVIDWT